MSKRVVLPFAALLSLAATLTTASAAEPVKLLHARSELAWDGFRLSGAVEVQNLAYEKKVTAVYRVNGGAWVEAPATYAAPTHDGLEAWTFQTPAVQPGYKQALVFDLYLRYEVAGRTYWDANGGQNYRLGTGYDPGAPMVVLAGSQVLLSYASPSSTLAAPGQYSSRTISGDVWVKNLAYEKVVRIVYTVDGWRTVSTAEAWYARPEQGDVEHWSFRFDVPVATSQVELAVEYQVSGQTWWDSALGRNYVVVF